MSLDRLLRDQLEEFLQGGHAHLGFEAVMAGLPRELRGKKADPDLPTPWQLLEHLRISQWDILEFCRNPQYVSPPWPEGYWPKTDAPPEEGAWERSVSAFSRDLRDLRALVHDEKNDLQTPFPHGQGQTLLREAILTIDHNAYHLGQMVSLRRLLDAWPPKDVAGGAGAVS